uniref:TOG domain-containing protein n=1 Tax=Caenorhabditis tropicalis TaxID=1561998 RepID=A0A1I7UJ81_9PELO
MDTNWLYVLLQKSTQDPLERLKLGNVILTEVSQRKVSPHPKLVNDFLDVMSGWLTGSNFKVSTIGLEILDAALRTSPEVLASYYFDRLAVLIERMGDAKVQVREMAINLCLKLAYLENSSPVMLLDRLCVPGTGFEHKQWLVKVGSLNILREFLSSSFALVYQQSIGLIPQLCRLTNDPNSEVRDASTACLIDLMVYGGKPIVQKIANTKLINEQKMSTLLQRYESTIATRGDLPPKHSIIPMETGTPNRNTLLRRSLRSPAKIIHSSASTTSFTSSARLSTPPRSGVSSPSSITPILSPLSLPSPAVSSGGGGMSRSRDLGRSSLRAPSMSSSSRYRSSSCAPGAQCSITVDDFKKAFTAVPKISIYSNSDVREKLEVARTVLQNANEDWSKRANQLKLIRSVVIHSDESIDRRLLISSINELADAVDFSIRDLRSQIVREAAITCSFLFETFGNDVRHVAETVMGAALAQVAVSTKIMASSAATLSVFIVQKIQTRQIFTCLSEISNSKSKEQRRQLANLLETLISTWDSKNKQPILKNIASLVQAAICDADGETRVAGRKAFAKLEQLHSATADQIFRDLDPAKQKMLRDGVSSSSSSLNSDRENNNQKSNQNHQNISQKFLSQRSASAVDKSQVLSVFSKPQTTPSRPSAMNSRLPKSSTSSFSAVRSSGYGQTTPLRAKTPNEGGGSKSSSSSPSTSTHQSSIQRVASNLGSSSFVASLTQEQASSLQSAMDLAKDELSRNNEDDEFLLGEVRKTQDTVDQILKACASSSINEKREGLMGLAQVISGDLDEVECKKIGDTLSRLLAEGNQSLILNILESIQAFVRLHYRNLDPWIKLALGKLFSKLATDSLPNVKSALLATQKTFLQTFDPPTQLKSVCEFMCDPVHLLVPRARLALLEYICILFEEIWPEDSRCLARETRLDTEYTRAAVRKMFQWMFDPRIGAILMPACERLVCALFALNAADFTMIFGDLPQDCRDWAYRILQLNGQQQRNTVPTVVEKFDKEISNNNYKPCPLEEPIIQKPSILKPVESIRKPEFSTSEYRKSTVHLARNHMEQANYIRNQLDAMREFDRPERVNEAMANLHGMMCEGSFTLWNQFFDELLDTVYQILSTLSQTIRKKLALRILQKMCTAQATKLFDSTEIAISKVLQCACSSEDSTMSVAAEDCLRCLASHLPLPRIVHISRRILTQDDDDQRGILILKMLTRMFQDIDIDELQMIIDDVAPCFVTAYESMSSTVRKCAVFGLVALVQRIGQQRMEPHLKRLNASKP